MSVADSLPRPVLRAFVFLLLILSVFLPRLLDLGSILTVDEPLWQGRSAQFIKGLATGHLDRAIVAGQPGVTTAWIAGLAHAYRSLAASQAAIGVATGFLVLLCTYFLVRLWGWRLGITGGFVLALQPLLLGHSRVVHTDALLALFSLASILALLAGLDPLRQRGSMIIRYLAASGALAALAILTKIFAIFLIPTALVIMAYHLWRYRQPTPHIIRAIGLWGGALIVVGYIAWPALWLHSDKVAALLLERGALHAEGTREEETTSAHWYYLREIPFRLSTIGSVLALVGAVGLVQTKRKLDGRWSMTWLLLSGGALLAFMSLGADKSDRYVLFTILAVELLGVIGIAFLSQLLPTQRRARALLLISCVVIGWLLIDTARLHPYYLAHYNRLYPIEATHKLGWGEGLEQAAAWVTQQQPDAKVASYYSRVFDAFYAGEVVPINHLEEASPDYVVLYRSMFERGQDSAESAILNRYLGGQRPADHVVMINGLPYVWIFSTH